MSPHVQLEKVKISKSSFVWIFPVGLIQFSSLTGISYLSKLVLQAFFKQFFIHTCKAGAVARQGSLDLIMMPPPPLSTQLQCSAPWPVSLVIPKDISTLFLNFAVKYTYIKNSMAVQALFFIAWTILASHVDANGARPERGKKILSGCLLKILGLFFLLSYQTQIRKKI